MVSSLISSCSRLTAADYIGVAAFGFPSNGTRAHGYHGDEFLLPGLDVGFLERYLGAYSSFRQLRAWLYEPFPLLYCTGHTLVRSRNYTHYTHSTINWCPVASLRCTGQDRAYGGNFGEYLSPSCYVSFSSCHPKSTLQCFSFFALRWPMPLPLAVKTLLSSSR